MTGDKGGIDTFFRRSRKIRKFPRVSSHSVRLGAKGVVFIYGNKGQEAARSVPQSSSWRGTGFLCTRAVYFSSEAASTPFAESTPAFVSEFWGALSPCLIYSPSAAHPAFSFTYRSPKDPKQQRAD